MLVGVGLLQRRSRLGRIGRPDDPSEPCSKENFLGPLAAQAIGEHETLAILLVDKVDDVGGDFLVCPPPRLAPDLKLLENFLPLLWLESEQALDPARQEVADRVVRFVLDLLAEVVLVRYIVLEDSFLEVDVSDLDVLR